MARSLKTLAERLYLRVGGRRYAALAGIVAFAGVVRFARLGSPAGLIALDETYYVPESRWFLHPSTPYPASAHPPVGKWFIAAGMKLFGDNAFGWRAASALVGTAGIVLLYLLARRMFNQRIALTAAALLAIEGLWLMQSRVAMLEIFVAVLVLVAAWLFAEDVTRTSPQHEGRRWWRIATGVALGLAFATKWIAAPFLVAGMVAAFVFEFIRAEKDPSLGVKTTRRRKRPTRYEREAQWRMRRRLMRQLLAIAGTFVLVPMLLYVTSFIPWFLASKVDPGEGCRRSSRVSEWFCYQGLAYNFQKTMPKYNKDGKLIVNWASEPWSWPWIGRPVTHVHSMKTTEGTKTDSAVVGLPNPVLWWSSFAFALPFLGVRAVRKRDRKAGILLALVGVGYLPYLVGSAGRGVFLYYATIFLPYLVLGLAYTLHTLGRERQQLKPGLWAFGGLAVLSFAYFYPLLTGLWINHSGFFGWRGHLWFTVDCVKETVRHLCWGIS